MGTKIDPGKFDCYEKAEIDEPLFTLLARDPLAPHLVALWAQLRSHQPIAAFDTFRHLLTLAELRPPTLWEKAREALECSTAMSIWRRNHPLS